jgi:hypothetical protein
MPRLFPLFVLALTLSACAPTAPTEPTSATKADRPNVLVILTDDQGYGDVGANGNDQVRTPHLDALAAESVRMSDFHA